MHFYRAILLLSTICVVLAANLYRIHRYDYLFPIPSCAALDTTTTPTLGPKPTLRDQLTDINIHDLRNIISTLPNFDSTGSLDPSDTIVPLMGTLGDGGLPSEGCDGVKELVSHLDSTRCEDNEIEMQELRRQNAEQQAEIARLQAAADERTALQRTIDELQATLAAKQQEVEQLRAQSKAQSEQIRGLEESAEQAHTSRAEVQDRCDQLKEKLVQAEAVFENTDDELRRLREQNAWLRDENSSLLTALAIKENIDLSTIEHELKHWNP